MTTYTVTATATDATTDTITVSSATNMFSGLPIVFSGTVFGGITAGATYYIGTVVPGFPTSTITVTSLPGGAIFALSTAAGSMTGTFNSGGQQIIDIGSVPNDGTGDPLRTAFNDTNVNFDQVFAAGPVGSNIQIANNTIKTINTNGNLVLAPNGTGIIQSNVTIVPNTANVRNLGSAAQRWSTIYTQYLDISGTLTTGDLTVDGNLTVQGNIIQVGNIVTETLTIQLANAASTANAASGAGITVGANDNIATLLYSSTSNTWTTNIGLSSVGNITAPYFFGNGSQLTGLPATYGNANVVTLLAGFGSNTVSTTGNITAGNLLAPGAVIATNFQGGNLQVTGNANASYVYAQGSISTAGFISAAGNITANVGSFFIGNGSQLTGLAATYGNANVVAYGESGWAGNIVPSGNAVYSLGNSTNQWNDLYVSNATIFMNNVPISLTAGNVLTVDGEAVLTNGSNTAVSTTGNITAGNLNSPTLNNSGNISVVASGNTWTFGTDGATIFPTLTVTRGDTTGSLTGQTLLFGDSTQEAIISTPNGTNAIASSQRFVINPGAGADGTTGEGGDIYLYAGRGGDAGGSGGDIKIRGGLGPVDGAGGYITMEGGEADVNGIGGYIEIYGGQSGNSNGGYLDLRGGLGQTEGGAVFIQGGQGQAGPGGPVNITGGVSGNGLAEYGNVGVIAGASGWVFNNTGNLVLPNDGVVYETNIPFGGLTGKTIALKPYGGTDADQQLLVYPTAGADFNHLHLTTGNLWNTEMFLGNDDFYVKLANTGNVVINSNDGNSNTAQWTFDNFGTMTLPGNMIISGNTSVFGANRALIQPADDLPLIALSSGANGAVSSIWVEDIANVGTSNIAAVYANPVPGSGNVRIVVGQNGVGSGPNLWDFDTAGTLTLPGGSRLRPLGANLDIFAGAGSYVNLITTDESTSVGVDGGGGYITTAGGTWDFDTTGNLTAPGNISAVGNIAGNNLIATGNIVLTGSLVGSGASPAPSLSGFSSVSAITVSASGNISATGNVTAGNIITSGSGGDITMSGGNITGAGNISAGNLIATGNIVLTGSLVGSGASPAPSLSGFSSVSAVTLSASGNITGNTAGFAIGYRDIPQVSLAGNATIAITDAGKHFYSTQSTNYTLTIANNASQGFQVGSAITVVNQGTGTITIAQGSGVTLYLAGNATASNRSVATFGMATIMKVATDTWFINGTGVS